MRPLTCRKPGAVLSEYQHRGLFWCSREGRNAAIWAEAASTAKSCKNGLNLSQGMCKSLPCRPFETPFWEATQAQASQARSAKGIPRTRAAA